MSRCLLPAMLLTTSILVASGCTREDGGLPDAIRADGQIESSAVLVKKVEPTRLADFTLVDQNGKSHRLYDLSEKTAVVLVWHGVGCPIVQQTIPSLKELRDQFSRKNIAFLMVNSNSQDTQKTIKAEAESFDLGIPVLKDANQKLAASLGVERTSEVFIVDPRRDWKIHYHGPVDDRLTYGRAKAKADNTWVRDVLTALLAGDDVAPIRRPADGCLINYIGTNS